MFLLMMASFFLYFNAACPNIDASVLHGVHGVHGVVRVLVAGWDVENANAADERLMMMTMMPTWRRQDSDGDTMALCVSREGLEGWIATVPIRAAAVVLRC